MTELIGQTLSKVRIESLIARGGMAEIYYGMHTTLQRPVAIKVLGQLIGDRAEQVERFQREARVIASLRHPNIVQIHDFDIQAGQPYIIMEYIRGPSLATYLDSIHKRGAKMPIGVIIRLLPPLASALTYAHSQGIIHRDVKPGNIMLLSKSGVITPGEPLPYDVEPILTDFGLVRMMDSAKLTSSGAVTGTPAYMSPEQARGANVDGRTDIYALGIVLYEMLAGKVPFEADSMMATLVKQLNEEPQPIPGISPALQKVLDKALDKNVHNRFQTPNELAAAFLTALGVSTLPPGLSNPSPAFSAAETVPPTQLDELPADPTPPSNGQSTEQQPPARPKTPPRPWWLGRAVRISLILIAIIVMFVIGRSLINPGVSFEPGGRVRFHDVAAAMDEVTVTTSYIPPANEGNQYEAWLVGGEERVSLGVLNITDTDQGEINYVDPQGENLLAKFDRFEITLEQNPDPSPNPSDIVAYSSAIPEMPLMHVRHLLVSFNSTPGKVALVYGLKKDAEILRASAHRLLEAQQSGDQAAMTAQAEAMVNLLVGSQGTQYGDLNQDGRVDDPGDGFGMFLNGENAGYIGGVRSHAGFAADAEGATEGIQMHAGHVIVCAQNVEGWATELRDLLTQILAAPEAAETGERVRQAVSLADRIIEGRDLDGNEKIEPIEGEGGVMTIIEHAHYMADMPVLEGMDQVPPPAK
jgi:serine/threonine protein kinase